MFKVTNGNRFKTSRSFTTEIIKDPNKSKIPLPICSNLNNPRNELKIDPLLDSNKCLFSLDKYSQNRYPIEIKKQTIPNDISKNYHRFLKSIIRRNNLCKYFTYNSYSTTPKKFYETITTPSIYVCPIRNYNQTLSSYTQLNQARVSSFISGKNNSNSIMSEEKS